MYKDITPSKLSTLALANRFKKGVGTGTGKDYVPWFTSENTMTSSHSGKSLCALDGRYRHHLSDLEDGLLMGALRDPFTTSARENFALTIATTKKICEKFNFRHPRSTGKGRPFVPYTTDMLISRSRPPHYVALAGKTRGELKKIADFKSLMVEHVFWSLQDVPFFVVTENEISDRTLISLRTLSPSAQVAEINLTSKAAFKRFHDAALNADWSRPLLEVVRAISTQVEVDSVEGLEIFKRLAWSGYLNVDLSLGITPMTRNVVSR